MADGLLGKLYVEVTADTKKFDTNIDGSKKKTDKFESGMNNMGNTIKGILGAGILLAMASKIKDIGTQAIGAASAAQEANAKFNTAFRGIETRAAETATALKNSYGLSQVESERLLGTTGDLLKGFGATADEALDFSAEIQKLAVDLTSYNDVQGGAERVSRILTKSVLGNKDGLTELGVSLLDVDIKQELVRTGQDKLTGQAGKLAKAQATYTLILQQTQDAQGDYARSVGSYNQTMIEAKARTSDLQVELGRALLPTATKGIGIFGVLTGKLGEYLKELNDIRVAEKAQEEGIITKEQELTLLRDKLSTGQKELKLQLNVVKTQKQQNQLAPEAERQLLQLERKVTFIGQTIGALENEIIAEAKLAEKIRKTEQVLVDKEEADRQAREARKIQHKVDIDAIEKIQDAHKTDIEIINEEIENLEKITGLTKEENKKRLDSIEKLQDDKEEILKEEELAVKNKNKKIKKDEEQALKDRLNNLETEKKARQEANDQQIQQVLGYADIAISTAEKLADGQLEVSIGAYGDFVGMIGEQTGMVELQMAAVALKGIDALLGVFSGSGDEIGEALGSAVKEASDEVIASLTNIGDSNWWEGLVDGFMRGMSGASEEVTNDLAIKLMAAEKKYLTESLNLREQYDNEEFNRRKALLDKTYKDEIDALKKQESEALKIYVSGLSAKEQLNLKASGVISETETERINREIDEATKAGELETVQTLQNEKAIIAIREASLVKQLEAQKEYDKKVRQFEYDKAVYNKELALSRAKIERTLAIASIPPYLEDGVSQNPLTKVVGELYSNLITQIGSTQLPQLNSGAIVPASMRGRPAIVGENNYPELIMSTSPQGSGIMEQFADALISKMGNSNSQPIIINQSNLLNLQDKGKLDQVAKLLYEPLNREKARRGA